MTDTPAWQRGEESAIQFLRYGVVGLATNVVGYLFFLLITHLGVEPKKSMTLLYALGASIGFFGNLKWTFSDRGSVLGSGAGYLVAHLFGYLINLILLLVLVDWLGYAYQWVQAVAAVVVAGFLFAAFKHYVFRSPSRRGRR